MKKRLLAVILSVSMLGTLIGCGGKPEATATPAEATEATKADEPKAEEPAESAEAATEPVMVNFWNAFTGADGEMLVELVDRFNAENTDGITVQMDISADLDAQLATALPAGKGPALLLGSSAARFTYGDYMQDISDVFDKTNLNKDDFMPSYLDYCSENGSLYFVPFQIVGYYMYWNKDLFEAAGLDPEKGPATWDEWNDYAAAIADPSKNVYGSGISYDYAFQIAHIMQRFGGLAVTKNDGKWVANFAGNEGYKKFLTDYKNAVDNNVNPLEADTDSMLSAGQVAMTCGGPWVTYGLDTAGINYGIGLIPQGDAGNMNSVEVLGFSITTSATDAEKQAAYKFIEWWNTENADGSSPALEWSLANGFPAYTYSVQEKDSYKSNAKLNAMSAADPTAPTDFIVDSSFPGINSIINDVIKEMINGVAFGSVTPDEALTNAQEAAEAIVAQYN